MKRPQLTVEKRTDLGKKVKKLRKNGMLPANIYGKGIQSVSVQVVEKDFQALFKEVKETGLVDLQLGSETRPVLIHNVQFDTLTRLPLHADFFQVNLKEKVTTMVPVAVVGEPTAVTEKVGLLLQQISEIEVEALPTDLPEKIEVNVEHLKAVGEQMTVADLKIPTGVEVKTDPEQIVVKIDELVSEEAKEVAAEMAAEAEAAQATTEAEGEEGKEGEKAEGETEEGEPSSAKATEGQAEEKTAEKPQEEKKE